MKVGVGVRPYIMGGERSQTVVRGCRWIWSGDGAGGWRGGGTGIGGHSAKLCMGVESLAMESECVKVRVLELW